MSRYKADDFRAAAIYKLGYRRGFDRKMLIGLLVDRAHMNSERAGLIVSHWLTTEPYRKVLSKKVQVLSEIEHERNETSNDYVSDNSQFGMGA